MKVTMHCFLQETAELLRQVKRPISIMLGFRREVKVGWFRKKEEIIPFGYPGYKDYRCDKSYWEFDGKNLVNTKPIIFAPNDSKADQLLNIVEMYDDEGRTILSLDFIDQLHTINPKERVEFEPGAIQVRLYKTKG